MDLLLFFHLSLCCVSLCRGVSGFICLYPVVLSLHVLRSQLFKQGVYLCTHWWGASGLSSQAHLPPPPGMLILQTEYVRKLSDLPSIAWGQGVSTCTVLPF